MDRVLSARVDGAVLQRLNMLSRTLHMSKKAILEGAIMAYAEKAEAAREVDILDQTCGAWQREESKEKTVENAREKFRSAMIRHHT